MGPLKFENREEIQRCHLSPASQLRCKARRLALTLASSPSTLSAPSYTLFLVGPKSLLSTVAWASDGNDHSGRAPTFLPEEYQYTVHGAGREGKENREKGGKQ